MPSAYLQETEFAAYGVPSATAQQVKQIGVLIDAYLKRPHGLLHVANSTSGLPCYMESAFASQVLSADGGPLAAGTNVRVPVTGSTAFLQVGDCLVIDKAVPTKVEATLVVSFDESSVTLKEVKYAHDAGVKLEAGLVITEQKTMPKGRSVMRLSHTPVAHVIGGTGRYGYNRRGSTSRQNMDEFNLLAAVNQFGGPPAWEIWTGRPSDGLNPDTGELWVPAGILLSYYSESKVRYVAGWTYETLPTAIKLATANLIIALNNNPILGDISRIQAADSHVEMLSSSMLSDDVKTLLGPYRAKVYG